MECCLHCRQSLRPTNVEEIPLQNLESFHPDLLDSIFLWLYWYTNQFACPVRTGAMYNPRRSTSAPAVVNVDVNRNNSFPLTSCYTLNVPSLNCCNNIRHGKQKGFYPLNLNDSLLSTQHNIPSLFTNSKENSSWHESLLLCFTLEGMILSQETCSCCWWQ